MACLPATAVHCAARGSPLLKISVPSCVQLQKRFGSSKVRRAKKEKVADTTMDDLVALKAKRSEASAAKIGAFKPLPAKQFGHALLQRHVALELPLFPTALQEQPAGSVMAFPTQKSKAISVFGVPRNVLLDFRLLSQPCSLVTESTTKMMETLDTAKAGSSEKQRYVLTGPRGCGKSFLLLQSVEYCLAKDWVVLYIPRSVKLLDSTTPFHYDPRTQTYLQPKFTHQILQRLATVNEATLSRLKVNTAILAVEGAEPILPETPLLSVIERGTRDPSISTQVLNVVMDELGRQNTHPVLLAVDDFQTLYSDSQYRDPNYEFIKAHHLSVPRLLLEFASGQRKLARGMVLGAISSSRTDFPLPLELREALGLPDDTMASPYDKRTPEYIAYAQGLKAIPVAEKLTLSEAASLFETWTTVNGTHTPLEDAAFLTKYTEASGNAREFVKSSLLNTLDS